VTDNHEDNLSPGLRAFGEDLIRAGQQRSEDPRSRRSWFRRPVLLAAVASVTIAGGAGAAVLISVGEPTAKRTDAPSDTREDGRRTLAIEARDPSGGLPWAASVYSQVNGEKCVIAGRLYRGKIGELRDRRFHAFPPDDYGVCGRPDEHQSRLLLASGPARGEPNRGLVVGRVASTVRRLQVRTEQGVNDVPLGEGGAFLLVFDGDEDLDRLRFTPIEH